jgi:hypothetical protein
MATAVDGGRGPAGADSGALARDRKGLVSSGALAGGRAVSTRRTRRRIGGTCAGHRDGDFRLPAGEASCGIQGIQPCVHS